MFNVGWAAVLQNLAKHDLEFDWNQPLLTTHGNGPDRLLPAVVSCWVLACTAMLLPSTTFLFSLPCTHTSLLPPSSPCYSVTGKKLLAKCRSLIQENQELGKQISQGRVAQLEAEIALQKKLNQEVKGALDGTCCTLVLFPGSAQLSITVC